MHDRARTVAMFLGHAGWGGANRTTLAGDASARRYDRLTQPDGSSAVLMDAPPASGEDIRPFTAMARWLTEQGFSAPLILADDAEDGLALLEDLGDNLYARVCAREPECEAALYEAAVDLLADLQRLDPPQWIAPYCGDTYEREAALLTDWYLPGATGKRVAKDLDHDYRALVRAACLDLPLARPVFVLRDYHAENLLWLPERMRHRRVGLLDFQDALAGHPVYDLVSLIEDARRDTSATLRRDMADRFAAATGTARDEVDLAVATLGAQRNLKIVGIFARLWLRDGKPAYLAMIPRVWAHLVRDLEHPALAALARLVNDHVPAPTADILARLRGART